MDQKTAAYRLDRKSNDYMSLLSFKIAVIKALIGRYSNRQSSFPTSRPSKWKFYEPSIPRKVPIQMPEFQ